MISMLERDLSGVEHLDLDTGSSWRFQPAGEYLGRNCNGTEVKF